MDGRQSGHDPSCNTRYFPIVASVYGRQWATNPRVPVDSAASIARVAPDSTAGNRAGRGATSGGWLAPPLRTTSSLKHAVGTRNFWPTIRESAPHLRIRSRTIKTGYSTSSRFSWRTTHAGALHEIFTRDRCHFWIQDLDSSTQVWLLRMATGKSLKTFAKFRNDTSRQKLVLRISPVSVFSHDSGAFLGRMSFEPSQNFCTWIELNGALAC